LYTFDLILAYYFIKSVDKAHLTRDDQNSVK